MTFSTTESYKKAVADAVACRVPAFAQGLVQRLCSVHNFAFRLAGSRSTKLGDFCAKPDRLAITLNRDLKPDLFLVTFLHELGHLVAHNTRKRREAPHGPHWKHCFGRLLIDCAAQAGIDDGLKKALLLHSLNPTATLHADASLARALRLEEGLATTADPEAVKAGVPLGDLDEGNCFLFKGKPFIKSGRLSKRHYATEFHTGRLFSFAPTCRVEPMANRPPRYVGLDLRLGGTLPKGQQFNFRGRKFTLEAAERSKLICRDIVTGDMVTLHPLMHMAVL